MRVFDHLHPTVAALVRLGTLVLSLLGAAPSHATPSHGYALWGDLKYPQGFAHFDYAEPAAPVGGTLRLVSNLRTSTFDKFNPFTLKGSAPAYLDALLFDTLLTASMDEPASAYGLLAEAVEIAADRRSATFTLRREARFHNGAPVLAADVKHSFDTLISAQAAPGYATLLADVERAQVLDARRVRFHFRSANRELPLTVGALPIFSRAWGEGKPFDQVVMDHPIGSGPYRIGAVDFGRDITYERDANYWARDLNVRRGMARFERIEVKIYRDHTARLQALKAGEFDLMRVFSAGDWARRMTGGGFNGGSLIKAELPHQLPTGFQSWVLNTRRSHLADARVREALGLAVDFEWMNARLFYGSYRRVRGLFGNTACASTQPPSAGELALMASGADFAAKRLLNQSASKGHLEHLGHLDIAGTEKNEPNRTPIPTAWLHPWQPPSTGDSSAGLRANLRRALALLKDAGFTPDDKGRLRDAQGRLLELELLDSSEAGVRTVSPWARNLEKIGVKLNIRIVDFALYQQRLRAFDYDIISLAFGGTHNPGQEYADLFGAAAADIQGSSNFAGVKNSTVDFLIQKMVQANDKTDYFNACRALERVIIHGHYLIPQWYAPVHKLAYNAQNLQLPKIIPAYYEPEYWAMMLGHSPKISNQK